MHFLLGPSTDANSCLELLLILIKVTLFSAATSFCSLLSASSIVHFFLMPKIKSNFYCKIADRSPSDGALSIDPVSGTPPLPVLANRLPLLD